jgi:hypothetical protein
MENSTLTPQDLELKYTRPPMLGELIEAFPEECKEFVPKRIKQLRKELKPALDFITKIRNSDEDEWFKEFWVMVCKEIYMPKYTAEEFAKFKIMQRMMSKTIKGITNDDIQLAKQVSIWDLYDFQKRRKNVACCPFHADSNASFSVRANRWCCFAGCGKGDSIDFYMKLHGLAFHKAVEELRKHG